ncbi:MAG: hypothetical protein HOG49_35665 [Candidatus Scalindua sp.]|jgi:hypothetical protein|nr:hypothetical protein [Candidatus Scalindua sp.]
MKKIMVERSIDITGYLEGDLVRVRDRLNELLIKYGEKNSRIEEEGSYDYREYILYYKRLETDAELAKRKRAVEKSEKMKSQKEETTKKRELTMLKKLKEKYE